MPLDQEPEEDEQKGEKEMSFLDHLEELRWHVIRAMIAIVVFTSVAFYFVRDIFNYIILGPAKSDFPTWKWLCALGEFITKYIYETDLCIEDIALDLQSRSMTGQFTITIISAFVIGLIFSFPYIAWEIWRFIRPGLKASEQKNSRGAVSAITLLFAAGVSFGYFVITPLMVYVLVNYRISDMINNQFDIMSYVSTVVVLVFGSGLLFELPVVIYFLSKIGLVTPKFLRQYRKHSIVIILVIAAIITPPDVLSQVLITLPLLLLFEISILISARVERQKLKRDEEERLREQQSAS